MRIRNLNFIWSYNNILFKFRKAIETVSEKEGFCHLVTQAGYLLNDITKSSNKINNKKYVCHCLWIVSKNTFDLHTGSESVYPCYEYVNEYDTIEDDQWCSVKVHFATKKGLFPQIPKVCTSNLYKGKYNDSSDAHILCVF